MSQDIYQKLKIIATNSDDIRNKSPHFRSRMYYDCVRDLLSTLRSVPHNDVTDILNNYGRRTSPLKIASAFDVKSDTISLFTESDFVKPECRATFANGIWVGFRSLEAEVSDFDKCGILRNGKDCGLYAEPGMPVEYARVNGAKIFEGRINNSSEFVMYGVNLSDWNVGNIQMRAWWLVHPGIGLLGKDSRN